MIWKQPIPVEIPQLKGDKFATTVFQILLLRCSNENRTVYVGDSTVELQRGQCVCGRYELAKCFGLKRKESARIRNVLSKLQITAKLITKRKAKDCSVITVLNYDEWVEMTKLPNNQTPIQDQSNATNKSDKSAKNNKVKLSNSNNSKKVEWSPDAIKALTGLGGLNL
jgi:hypothetical protein